MQRNRKGVTGSGQTSTKPKATAKVTVDDAENKVVIEKADQVTTIIRPTTESQIKFPVPTTETKKGSKVGGGSKKKEARTNMSDAFKSSKFAWLAVFMGIPWNQIRDGETKLIVGFDDQDRITELEKIWKGDIVRRAIALEKVIESTHAPNAQYILDRNPNVSIAEAQRLLLDTIIASSLDSGNTRIALSQLGILSEPFRYWMMRKSTDYVKTKSYDKYYGFSCDADNALFGFIDDSTVSCADNDEHRKALNDIWEWFCAYSLTKSPWFME